MKGICDNFTGSLTDHNPVRFARGFIANVEWFPNDAGLFNITFSKFIQLIDTERLEMCETFHFSTLQVFWSDWNPINTNLISIAASNSMVRFIDVRSGDNLQHLVVPSLINAQEHSITRVLWDRMDSEAIFVGDSSGFIHIFDIRNPRHPVISTSCDSTFGQPVVSLQQTTDLGQIISCHGFHQNMVKWTFQNKKLVNSNVNFDTLKPNSKSSTPSFLKTSLFVTDDLVFSPAPPGKGDILINDIHTGVMVKRLSTDTFHPSKNRRTNVVQGLCSGSSPLLFSGGRNNFKVWTHAFDQTACDEPIVEGDQAWKDVLIKPDKVTQNPLHADDWSDSD